MGGGRGRGPAAAMLRWETEDSSEGGGGSGGMTRPGRKPFVFREIFTGNRGKKVNFDPDSAPRN